MRVSLSAGWVMPRGGVWIEMASCSQLAIGGACGLKHDHWSHVRRGLGVWIETVLARRVQ
jgi:hypothetical protein